MLTLQNNTLLNEIKVYFSTLCNSCCDYLIHLHKPIQPALQLQILNLMRYLNSRNPLMKQTSPSHQVTDPASINLLASKISTASQTGTYLQVGTLQPAVHVLLPRVRQLSVRWTRHGVHAPAGNAPIS